MTHFARFTTVCPTCFIFLIVLSTWHQNADAQYSVTNLGAGGPAICIDSNGDVAGSLGSGGFIYSGGSEVNIGSFIPYGINNSLLVVGSAVSGNFETPAEYYNGFGGGSYRNGFGALTGVNSSSTVCGWTSDGTTYSAFVQNTAIPTLNTTNVRSNSAAAINDAGEVIGWSSGPNGTGIHAFSYYNGQLTDLLSTTPVSHATAINSLGEIVGDIEPNIASTVGFLYNNGQVTNLGSLGGSQTQPTGINDLVHDCIKYSGSS